MIARQSARTLLAAALAVPLAASALIWATTWRTAQQGQDWLIPIKGYDPADLLRGHYIQYRYDWPVEQPAATGVEEVMQRFDPAYGALCIVGVAPNLTRVRTLDGDADAHGCAIVVRATLGARREVQGLDTGILFASQARALALAEKLADPKLQGMIQVRIRNDGVMRPIDIVFRPRAQR